MNNDMTGLLNLAYEIEGLLLLRINRGDETPSEMKELLAGKAKLLADALAACDAAVVCDAPAADADAAVVCDAPAADADAAVEEQEAEAEAEIPAETAAVSHEDADVRTPESEIAESAEAEEKADADEAPSGLTLDEKLARERAADISKAFTLNDRFRFCRELFRNSNEEFKETLEVIGSMADMDEAEEYFYNDLCWDSEKEEVKEFMAIVAKHF